MHLSKAQNASTEINVYLDHTSPVQIIRHSNERQLDPEDPHKGLKTANPIQSSRKIQILNNIANHAIDQRRIKKKQEKYLQQ